MHLSPFPYGLLALWPSTLLSTLISNTLRLWPFPKARDEFSHPYKQQAVMCSSVFMFWNARREDERILTE